MTILRTPRDRSVRVVEEGRGTPVVFLHGGVGTVAEWKRVLDRWSGAHRRIAIDAYGVDNGPGPVGGRTIDDYADQVQAVAEYVGEPLHLVGFSWGGATALRVATTTPAVVESLTVIEPQAYSLLPHEHPEAFATISGMRDRWRAHVAAGRWHDAFAEFLDYYNGPGSFDSWPAERRDAFLAEQRTRGDLWDVLFESPLTPAALTSIQSPTLVVEGDQTAEVERALCEVVARCVPRCRHAVLDGAGHMMPLTHPDALIEVVQAHVARATGGVPTADRPGHGLGQRSSTRPGRPSSP